MGQGSTVCPHCGGPEQIAPSCVTCGALLWFQQPVPDDVADTDERVYVGLAAISALSGTGTRSAAAAPAPGAGTGGSAEPVEGRSARVVATAAVFSLLAATVLGGWWFLDRQAEQAAPATAPGGPEAGGTGADPAPGAGACSGEYVVVLPGAARTRLPSGAGGDGQAACADLAAAVAASPASYEGPLRSARAACRRRDEVGGSEVHVRELAEDAGPRFACSCLVAPRKLPDLAPVGVEGAGVGRGGPVSDAQVLLHAAGYNPDLLVGGSFGSRTVDWVRELQADAGLEVTGRVDRDTWKVLLGTCG